MVKAIHSIIKKGQIVKVLNSTLGGTVILEGNARVIDILDVDPEFTRTVVEFENSVDSCPTERDIIYDVQHLSNSELNDYLDNLNGTLTAEPA